MQVMDQVGGDSATVSAYSGSKGTATLNRDDVTSVAMVNRNCLYCLDRGGAEILIA